MAQVVHRPTGIEVRLKKAGRQFGEVLFTIPPGRQPAAALVNGGKRDLRQIAPNVLALGLTLEGEAVIEVEFSET